VGEPRKLLNEQQKENIKKYVQWGWLDEAVMKATRASRGQVRAVRKENNQTENLSLSTGRGWVDTKEKISKLKLPNHSFIWETARDAVKRRRKEKEARNEV
jgi:hypothetical protein